MVFAACWMIAKAPSAAVRAAFLPSVGFKSQARALSVPLCIHIYFYHITPGRCSCPSPACGFFSNGNMHLFYQSKGHMKGASCCSQLRNSVVIFSESSQAAKIFCTTAPLTAANGPPIFTVPPCAVAFASL